MAGWMRKMQDASEKKRECAHIRALLLLNLTHRRTYTLNTRYIYTQYI